MSAVDLISQIQIRFLPVLNLIGFGWIQFWKRTTAKGRSVYCVQPCGPPGIEEWIFNKWARACWTNPLYLEFPRNKLIFCKILWWCKYVDVFPSIRNIGPTIGITDQASQIPNIFERFRLHIKFTVHCFAPHLVIEYVKKLQICPKTWLPSPTTTFPSQSVQPQCRGALVLSCLDSVLLYWWMQLYCWGNLLRKRTDLRVCACVHVFPPSPVRSTLRILLPPPAQA